MRNTLSIFVILQIAFSSIGQSSQFSGMIVDSITNEPISFARVFLLKKNQIISGASTDFDGQYIFKNINCPIDSFTLEIRQIECYETKTISKINTINDSIIIKYKLSPFDCDTIKEKQCKYLGDSCEIYEVKFMWDVPRKVKRKYRNKQILQDENKFVYLPSEYYQNECCYKKWYCKTHKYRY